MSTLYFVKGGAYAVEVGQSVSVGPIEPDREAEAAPRLIIDCGGGPRLTFEAGWNGPGTDWESPTAPADFRITIRDGAWDRLNRR